MRVSRAVQSGGIAVLQGFLLYASGQRCKEASTSPKASNDGHFAFLRVHPGSNVRLLVDAHASLSRLPLIFASRPVITRRARVGSTQNCHHQPVFCFCAPRWLV